MTEFPWTGPAVAKLVEENKRLRALVVALLTDPETAPAGLTPSPAPERQWWDPPLPEPHGERRILAVDAPAGPASNGPGRLDPRRGPEREAVIADHAPEQPGEPPVGSVVTDTRTRVCTRVADDPRGWYRPGTEQLLTWDEVWQAVGGPDLQPQPGPPTLSFQPPQRVEVPMVVRPGAPLQTVRQVALLGPDGEPTGKLKPITESVEIFELVPDGG